MTSVLVTGGTGALGVELVPLLVAAGHDVRVLSRKQRPDVPTGVTADRGDLNSGDGLAEATRGVDIIAHFASGTDGTPSYKAAKRTDVNGTQALLSAARQNGEPHILYISIVGVDKIPFGYYRAKLETEAVIESSGLPHTILRTTQWHSLAWEICRRLAQLPAVVLPKGVRMQLLDASEVAKRMVPLAQGPPPGHVDEMGGPEVIEFADIMRRYLNAMGKRRPVGSMPFPGKLVRAFRENHNLAPDRPDGRITWDQYLAKRARASSASLSTDPTPWGR